MGEIPSTSSFISQTQREVWDSKYGLMHVTCHPLSLPAYPETKKDDSDVATGVNCAVLHVRVGLSRYVILRWTLQELEGP